MTLSELSGRADALETNVSFLVQDNLRKIDLNTLSQYSITWNQQLDSIENTVLNMQAQLNTLQTLYTNLFMTVQSNYAAFTGYTGSV